MIVGSGLITIIIGVISLKLRIGENIKRLRKVKGLTQEQLGELLNVSCAAVSKWESGDTYPDITMMFPLAHLFEVSVDELMGYDAARTEADIVETIREFKQLRNSGKWEEATKIICRARNEFPNDYRIMIYYMWELAGGSADNDAAILLKHKDEILKICECIQNGCTDDSLRLETLTMKAKLLHADGNTTGAVELLQKLPSWYQCAGQKTEQLFAKDTAEFRYWVRKNLYELADFAADKAVKSVFFDNSLSYQVKVDKVENIADMISELGEKADDIIFTVITKSLFGRLANDLAYRGGEEKDIIRIREKHLNAVKKLTEKAKDDTVLFDVYKQAHETDDLLQWTVDSLKTSKQMLDNNDYQLLLERYSN